MKLFVTCEIYYFELGIFSFNSYVYYLSRGFIASTRAFNLLTSAFKLPTRAFNLPTCAFNHATHDFSLLTRGSELVTRGFELVTRNSCFTFPLKWKGTSLLFCWKRICSPRLETFKTISHLTRCEMKLADISLWYWERMESEKLNSCWKKNLFWHYSFLNY